LKTQFSNEKIERRNMKNKKHYDTTPVWQQYEDGKEYKRRIQLYSTVRENERFFRGDQWRGVVSNGLPTPVFNIVSRIINYLVNAVMAYQIRVNYHDDSLPFLHQSADTDKILSYMDKLNRFTDYRFKRYNIDTTIKNGVFDAAISGDGVFFTYWDPDVDAGVPYKGDFRTITVDNVNLFVADMNKSDIQSQEYVILAGRESVNKLRKEALLYGASEEDVQKIVPDSDTDDQSGDFARYENQDVHVGKATFLIKFYRDENGHVVWEKSTQYCLIRKAETTMRLFPVAKFSWERVKNAFHGSSPVSGLIQNQKYINKAYAMAMKHMTDTAFSKVIYDKKLIPEWSNEVGQAIGVISGGDIKGVAAVLETGEMQDNFLEIIEQVIRHTKEMSGATEIALGEADPTNTSAILALREAAELPLGIIRSNINRCIEDLADVWMEMMCEHYVDGRPICYIDGDQNFVDSIDFARLRRETLRASVDIGTSSRFSQTALINTLDNLLREEKITFVQYLERLPEGIITNKAALLNEVRSNAESSCPAVGVTALGHPLTPTPSTPHGVATPSTCGRGIKQQEDLPDE